MMSARASWILLADTAAEEIGPPALAISFEADYGPSLLVPYKAGNAQCFQLTLAASAAAT